MDPTNSKKYRTNNLLPKLTLLAKLPITLVKFHKKFGSQTCRDLRPLAAILLNSHLNENQFSTK